MRWIALLLLPAVILVVACGEEGAVDIATPTVEVTAVGTPVPPASAEGPSEQGFRRFIPVLQEALEQSDLAFLAERAQTIPVVCTSQDEEGREGGPQCEFEGQTYDGFTVGYWRSEGTTSPISSALSPFKTLFSDTQPAASDEFGDGYVRVHALSLAADRYDAIITAMIKRPDNFAGSGPLRVAIGTSWSFAEDRWRMNYMLVAFVLAEDLLTPSEEGSRRYPNWERYQVP